MLTTKQKITIARVASAAVLGVRRLGGFGPVTQARRHGIDWELDLAEGIDLSIFLLGCFEPTTRKAYQQLVREGDTVIDIGANIGSHTLPLAQQVGESGKVFAFEPTDFAFSKLKSNLALNAHLQTRVVAEQIALSDGKQNAPREFYSSWPVGHTDNSPLHGVHGGRLNSATGSKVVTLDAYVREHGLEKVDFIKLDVDGFEVPVLRGARETLQRFRPTILFEAGPYLQREYGHSMEALLRPLLDLGYRLESDKRHPLPNDVSAIESQIRAGATLNIIGRCERSRYPQNSPLAAASDKARDQNA